MIDLKAIRETAGKTKYELGQAYGLHGGREIASAITRMENRSDWLVSRLRTYINAAGGSAELVVYIDGKELRFQL